MKTRLRYNLLIMLVLFAGVRPALAQTTKVIIEPAGMALIPAGTFTMGDTLDGKPDAIPTKVYVSAFYMDTNLVSYSQWITIYNLATIHGATLNLKASYDFANSGAHRGEGNYPVQAVSWYDCVKWCNARSQQAGLTAVHYTDTNLTQVYSKGDMDAVYPNWAANGYRLPTEAEWEKAARGGLNGQRFPWGDTISESQANYSSIGSNTYADGIKPGIDSGPPGFNSSFTNKVTLHSDYLHNNASPVGSFAANGYGLYDMAGNLQEWCWDWYGTSYAGGRNPHGPASGSKRILRGGCWCDTARHGRCADRLSFVPELADNLIGFRCVRGN